MTQQSNYYTEELVDPQTYHLSNSDINDILLNPREWIICKLLGDRKNMTDAMEKGVNLHALTFGELETGKYIVTPNGKQQFRMDDPEWINYTISDYYDAELWDEKKVNVELKSDTVFYKGNHIVPKELPRFSLTDYINAYQLKMEIFNGGFAEKEFYASTELGNFRGKVDYYKSDDVSVKIIDLKTKMDITFDDKVKVEKSFTNNLSKDDFTGIELILTEKIKNYALQMFIYKALLKSHFPEKDISFSFCFLICSKDGDMSGKSNKYFVEDVHLTPETEEVCIQKIQKARNLIVKEFEFVKQNPNFSLDNIGFIKNVKI